MSCHDASRLLRLNIKVGSENLLAGNSRRRNVGSLRLPPDPPWLKAHQRRLSGHLELHPTQQPPYRLDASRYTNFSRERTSGSQLPKYDKNCNPGSFDPRFKRVTSAKNDPVDRLNSENESSVLSQPTKEYSTLTRNTRVAATLESDTQEAMHELRDVKNSGNDIVESKKNNCPTNIQSGEDSLLSRVPPLAPRGNDSDDNSPTETSMTEEINPGASRRFQLRKTKSEQIVSGISRFTGQHCNNTGEPRTAILGKRCDRLFNERQTSPSRKGTESHCHCYIHSDTRNAIANLESNNSSIADTTEITPELPIKTQELLNKSYLEYYDKLQSRSVGVVGISGSREDVGSSSRHCLTLQALSTLSCIINHNLETTLDNSKDVDGNTKQDHSGAEIVNNVAQQTITESCPRTTLRTGKKRINESFFYHPCRGRNSAMKFETIAFAGTVICALAVSVPTLYSHWANNQDYPGYYPSYVDFALEYIASSFEEAFGGLFEIISRLFF